MPILTEDILSTGNLELLAKHAVEGFITGYHKSPFHGFSVEFAEHRQYNIGESIKDIDWRLYGRSDRLYVKKFEEETNLRCRLVIDASSSMHYRGSGALTKFQFALWCSSVFVQLLKKQRDAVGIDLFDDHVFHSSLMSSSGRHYRETFDLLSSKLEYKVKDKKTDLPRIIHELANKMHRRSMVVFFTDLLSNQYDENILFDAVQHLKHNKMEVIVFNLLDHPTELYFDYDNRPMTFKDLETGETIKLQASEVKQEYKRKMQDYLKAMKLKFAQYKVDYVEVDTSKSVEHAIIPFLVKRNRMSR